MKGFKAAFTAALAVFTLGFIAGLSEPSEWVVELVQREVAGRVALSFWPIYAHNLKAAGLIYLASILYVGLALVLVNGYIAGAVAAVALGRGLTPLQVAAALAPHGVFEVPALLASSAAGMVTVDYLSRGLRGAARLALTLAAVAALLAVAAFVEAYVTPLVMGLAGAGASLQG
ncbi:stage II sporulation protein M [Stetteria hydrogenophila]